MGVKTHPLVFLRLMSAVFHNIAAVVLAGGKSRRMGQDKRFLDVGGQPLIQRVLAVLAQVFHERVIVTAEREACLEALGVPVLTDIRPGYATLGGLYTGLKSTTRACVFAVASDMPCLDPKTIDVFVSQAEMADVVIAALSTGVQPMHAVYGKACLPILERMMDEGDLKIQNLLNHPSLRVQYVDEAVLRLVDPQLRSFININTPADLEMVRKLLVARTHASPSHH